MVIHVIEEATSVQWIKEVNTLQLNVNQSVYRKKKLPRKLVVNYNHNRNKPHGFQPINYNRETRLFEPAEESLRSPEGSVRVNDGGKKPKRLLHF